MRTIFLALLFMSGSLVAASCPDFSGTWTFACNGIIKDEKVVTNFNPSLNIEQKECESFKGLVQGSDQTELIVGKTYTVGSPKGTLAEKLDLPYKVVVSAGWNDSNDRLLITGFIFEAEISSGFFMEMTRNEAEDKLHLKSIFPTDGVLNGELSCVGKRQ